MFLNNNDNNDSIPGANGMHVTLLNVTDKASSEQLEKVRARKNHRIITLYYRDGCPPCDRMKPEWKKACENFKKMYKCKNEDARERTVIASVDDNGIKYLNNVVHNIPGTPTLLYMSDNNVQTYDKPRNAKHLLKWLHHSLKNEIEPARFKGGGCWSGKKMFSLSSSSSSLFGRTRTRTRLSKKTTRRRKNNNKKANTNKNRK